MTQQHLNLGNPLLPGSGDPAPVFGSKCENNFNELYAAIAAWVSVAKFGVKGDGVTDDTSAMQAAAAAGVDLVVPSTFNIKTTGSVALNAGQSIIGAGMGLAQFTPVGNFDVFTVGGSAQGTGLARLRFNGAGMTGGNIINVTGANRVFLEMLLMLTPFNGINVKKCNVAALRSIWMNAIAGSYGVQWVGDASNRSDVLDIDNLELSGVGPATAASPTGIIMDGNVDTLDIRHLACTNMLRGILVQNTAGAGAPQFVTAYDFQCDSPYAECVRLTAALRSALFTDGYYHGSLTADNIYVDSTVQHVTFQGGKCDSAHQRGGYLDGRYISVSNMQCSTNSQAGSGLWPGWEIGPDSIGVRIAGGLAGQWIGYATEKQSYGVLIDSGAQTYSVTGVNLANNVTGPYQDNANDAGSIVVNNSQTGGNLTQLARGVSAVILGNETNGVAFQALAADALSVNFLKAFGKATGIGPILAANGSDTNIDMQLQPKGTGQLTVQNGNGVCMQAQAADVSSVNFLKLFAHATGSAPTLAAAGTDTNIDVNILPKGSGLPQFGNAASFTANGSVATSLGSLGPAGSHTTVQGWLTFKDNSGTVRYVACF